jgi:hypothetical protein
MVIYRHKVEVQPKYIKEGLKMQADEKVFEQTEGEDVTATEAILQTVKELADKCETLDEFREALARIIANK